MSSFDWADVLDYFAAERHWTPRQVLEETTAAQLWALLRRALPKTPYDPGRVRDEINRRRLAKGLPPMKPAPAPKRKR